MNVRGRDLGGFVDEARARVTAQAPSPAGVTVEWGGEFENKERAMARLELVVPGGAGDHAAPPLQGLRLASRSRC